MTESEWLACTDPAAMLDFLQRPAARPMGRSGPMMSDRKLRLVACACWWRFEAKGEPDGLLRYALRAVEEWADSGKRPRQTVMRGDIADYVFGNSVAMQAATATLDSLPHDRDAQAVIIREIIGNPFRPLDVSSWRCGLCGKHESGQMGGQDEKEFCRDCGESWSWRPKDWFTPVVVSLAEAAYAKRQERDCQACRSAGTRYVPDPCPDCGNTALVARSGHLDPARLAVLADALEEAGCTGDGILSHLRSPGPHVRGCWVVDLILDKS